MSDLQYLLEIKEEDSISIDNINLWDDKDQNVRHGISYKEGD